MKTNNELKVYLLVNRLIIAVMAMLAIWLDSLLSEVFASLSTLLWVFLSDVIRIEIRLVNKKLKSL